MALAHELLGVGARRAGPVCQGASATGAAPGNVLADPVFWKQQVYLLQRLVVGFALAIAELALLAAGSRRRRPADRLSMDGHEPRVVEDRHARARARCTCRWACSALVICAPARPALRRACSHADRRPARTAATSADADAVRTYSGDAPASPRRPRGRARRRRGAHDPDLGAHDAWLLLADLARARRRRPARHARLGRARRPGADGRAPAAADARARDPGGPLARVLPVPRAASGRIRRRGYFWPVWPVLVLLVAFGVHAAIALGPALRRGELARADRGARDEPRRRGRPAGAPSCAASSATCTTARRRGSSRSA